MVQAKSDAQQRRERVDAATRDYEQFLTERAVPLFHTLANALVAEGLRFKVFTPAGAVRLASDSSGEDFVELALDTAGDRPQVMGRSSRGRGRRLVTSERPVKEGTDIAALTEDDVMSYVLEEILPLIVKA